ncbi:DUF4139 domain-containing protein [bacterium DOLJORAL78_65_58]|nr:MAG: DUF4139 domain-containing protein [bacterium DOLZORAL124_64_63]PIE76833.1 MAG: DUF4139 domain-containing protein [bacterium DOLJORAL78_65_58]
MSIIRKSILLSALMATLLTGALPALAATTSTTTAKEDRMSVAVTIYNNNLALIKDRRQLDLDKGVQTLDFREVSGEIRPETALLKADNLTVLEQNFEFDLLMPSALLEKYVGREVTVIRTHPTTGQETRQKARILSATNGVVLEIDGTIETGVPGRIVYPDVPENLRDKPTLTMLVDSGTSRAQEVELSYLSGGLGWKADYVAELNEKDTMLDIRGWVTLTNTSGAAYENALLQLVAGEVNQVRNDQRFQSLMLEESVMKASAGSGMEEEELFAYHLYTLDRPTTIKNNQKKQVALMSAQNVPCRKELVLEGGGYYYSSKVGEIGKKLNPTVYVEIRNREKDNLGMPLPAGVVRVYKEDSSGRVQFVGEDRIAHTPRNETMRLLLGEAFDVTADRIQTDFRKIQGNSRKDYIYESSYSIELKNGGSQDVEVKIVEPVPGDWEILRESHKYKKSSSNTATWVVKVPADGSTKLTYTVRSRF